MLIKQATIEDWGTLQLLAEQAHKELLGGLDVNNEKIFRFLNIVTENPSLGCVLIAFEDEVPVGAISIFGGEGFVSDSNSAKDFHFYVSPYARGRKAGIKLIRASEKWAKDNGYVKFTLSIPIEKRSDLFDRLGYKETHVCYEKEL